MSKLRKVDIHAEYSAQARSHPPNPTLETALEVVGRRNGDVRRFGRVADLGCGKLRHYRQLAMCSDKLFLIDTPAQLTAKHTDKGLEYTVRSVAECATAQQQKVQAMAFKDFAVSHLNLNVVVCVAVLDVVLPYVRLALIRAAARNLAPDGECIIIVPRNDSTILRRCGRDNAYSDGYVFSHHGIHTFFHNYRDHTPIVRTCVNSGLRLLDDLSCYRHVCLVFGRARQAE
jgi:SAM-dependent methyltransferase